MRAPSSFEQVQVAPSCFPNYSDALGVALGAPLRYSELLSALLWAATLWPTPSWSPSYYELLSVTLNCSKLPWTTLSCLVNYLKIFAHCKHEWLMLKMSNEFWAWVTHSKWATAAWCLLTAQLNLSELLRLKMRCSFWVSYAQNGLLILSELLTLNMRFWLVSSLPPKSQPTKALLGWGLL